MGDSKRIGGWIGRIGEVWRGTKDLGFQPLSWPGIRDVSKRVVENQNWGSKATSPVYLF